MSGQSIIKSQLTRLPVYFWLSIGFFFFLFGDLRTHNVFALDYSVVSNFSTMKTSQKGESGISVLLHLSVFTGIICGLFAYLYSPKFCLTLP